MLHGNLTKPVTTRHPKAYCYMALLSPLLHSTLNLIATQHPLQSLQLHDTLYKVCFYTAPITQPVTKWHLLQSPLLHGTYYKARCYTTLLKAQVLSLAIFYQKPKYYSWQYFIKNPNTILAKFYKNSNTIKSPQNFTKTQILQKLKSPSTILGNILSKAQILFQQKISKAQILFCQYFTKAQYYFDNILSTTQNY